MIRLHVSEQSLNESEVEWLWKIILREKSSMTGLREWRNLADEERKEVCNQPVQLSMWLVLAYT